MKKKMLRFVDLNQATPIKRKTSNRKEDFNEIMKKPGKCYRDYPSNAIMFEKFAKYTVPLLKLIFVHKPQSLFQAEMRNN